MTLAKCSGVETMANFNHRPSHRAYTAVVVARFDMAMCAGVETKANFNHRHLHHAYGEAMVACFDLCPGHVFWRRNNSEP